MQGFEGVKVFKNRFGDCINHVIRYIGGSDKSCFNTKGFNIRIVLSAGTGTEVPGAVALRYGGTVYEKVSYRLYAKYFARDHQVDADGQAGPDNWDMWRAGFRSDWALSDSHQLTLRIAHQNLIFGKSAE